MPEPGIHDLSCQMTQKTGLIEMNDLMRPKVDDPGLHDYARLSYLSHLGRLACRWFGAPHAHSVAHAACSRCPVPDRKDVDVLGEVRVQREVEILEGPIPELRFPWLRLLGPAFLGPRLREPQLLERRYAAIRPVVDGSVLSGNAVPDSRHCR